MSKDEPSKPNSDSKTGTKAVASPATAVSVSLIPALGGNCQYVNPTATGGLMTTLRCLHTNAKTWFDEPKHGEYQPLQTGITIAKSPVPTRLAVFATMTCRLAKGGSGLYIRLTVDDEANSEGYNYVPWGQNEGILNWEIRLFTAKPITANEDHKIGFQLAVLSPGADGQFAVTFDGCGEGHGFRNVVVVYLNWKPTIETKPATETQPVIK